MRPWRPPSPRSANDRRRVWSSNYVRISLNKLMWDIQLPLPGRNLDVSLTSRSISRA